MHVGSFLEGLQQWVEQDLKKLSLCGEVCILVSIAYLHEAYCATPAHGLS